MDQWDRQNRIANPIATILLLHFKSHPDLEFGIRELQRILKIKSSGSVFKYLKILMDAGLVEKSKIKKYSLTNEGKDFKNFSFPVLHQIQYYNGFILPKFSFLLAFIVTCLIINIIFLVFKVHLIIVVINSFLCIIVVLIIVLKEWNYSRIKYQDFLNMNE